MVLTLIKIKFIEQLAIESINSNTKVFCIGLNKTGTTSLNRFMEVNGFKCGNQSEGELLIGEYAKSNWKPILAFCKTAEFFQDLPFSAPRTAKVLLEKFPKAIFILTERSSPEIWYDSLCNFHKKYFKASGLMPNSVELKQSDYRYPGFAWDANRALYKSPEDDPYSKEILIESYIKHSAEVRTLFKGRSNLLTLSIEDSKAVSKLEAFLKIESKIKDMPWLNKTSSLSL